MTITPELALGIYQLAMLIKKDFVDRNQNAAATDEDVIAGLQVDVTRVVGKIDKAVGELNAKKTPPLAL